jgi:hypothetical protein
MRRHANKSEPCPLSIDEQRLLFLELAGHLAKMASFGAHRAPGTRSRESTVDVEGCPCQLLQVDPGTKILLGCTGMNAPGYRQALHVSRSIHPLVKHANDRDPVFRDSKVNHMPLDITAAVPLTNVVTRRSRVRQFGQSLECRCQQVGLPLGLFNSPLAARVFPNAFQVALGGWGEPVLSHARGVACA